MTLPALAFGKRFTLPRPPGSADALVLAQLAQREKAAGRITAIVTADAADAQRLLDEIAFFAPELRCALFPDWETLPYDTFSPHQDLISERLQGVHDERLAGDRLVLLWLRGSSAAAAAGARDQGKVARGRGRVGAGEARRCWVVGIGGAHGAFVGWLKGILESA